jgi:hypothetical protein
MIKINFIFLLLLLSQYSMSWKSLNQIKATIDSAEYIGELNDHDREVLESIHQPFFGTDETYRPISQDDITPLVVSEMEDEEKGISVLIFREEASRKE